MDFPLFEKIHVNGRSRHPLYAQLTQVPDATGTAGKVKWNFEKFLVAPSGQVRRFRSAVEPEAPEVVQSIEAALSTARSLSRRYRNDATRARYTQSRYARPDQPDSTTSCWYTFGCPIAQMVAAASSSLAPLLRPPRSRTAAAARW